MTDPAKIKATRETDNLLYEKLTGEPACRCDQIYIDDPAIEFCIDCGCRAAPRYTTDISAAYQLLQHRLLVSQQLIWTIVFSDNPCYAEETEQAENGYRRTWMCTSQGQPVIAPTAPLAICRAWLVTLTSLDINALRANAPKTLGAPHDSLYISLNDDFETMLVRLASGNPGALNALCSLVKSLQDDQPKMVMACFLLDDMNLYGERLHLAHKLAANYDPAAFQEKIFQRDPEMIRLVNEARIGPNCRDLAVTYGASVSPGRPRATDEEAAAYEALRMRRGQAP